MNWPTINWQSIGLVTPKKTYLLRWNCWPFSWRAF